MTFSTEQTAMLEDLRTEFGESSTWNRYTHGTPNVTAGTRSKTLAEGPTTVSIVRTPTTQVAEPAGSGGRTPLDSFEAWLLAADLGWTPEPDNTEVTFGGITYRPALVQTENDGKVHRCTFQRLARET